MMRRLRKLILPAAGTVLLFASRAHSGVAVAILIGAGIPVALLLAGAVAWLLWRVVHDSLPLPSERRQVRAEIKIIRGAVEDGSRRPPG